MCNSKIFQEVYMIMTTEEDKKKAYKIANILLEAKLIACVNFKNIESHFWWRGEINKSKEVQLLMKCKEQNIEEVFKIIYENHSYEIPEIIFLPVSANKDYCNWVASL